MISLAGTQYRFAAAAFPKRNRFVMVPTKAISSMKRLLLRCHRRSQHNKEIRSQKTENQKTVMMLSDLRFLTSDFRLLLRSVIIAVSESVIRRSSCAPVEPTSG
jgi:hypothetical protein